MFGLKFFVRNPIVEGALIMADYQIQCGQKGGIFPLCGIFGPKGGTDFCGWGSVGIIQKGGDFEEFHKNRKILLF